MGKTTPPEGGGNADPLRALARALAPLIRDELGLDAAEHPGSAWLTAEDTPTPRATKAACRRGLIRGARKVHRVWMFGRDAWRDYVERVGVRGARAPDAVPPAVRGEDVSLDELRAEVGLARRGGSR
jgi:hypothetical protein